MEQVSVICGHWPFTPNTPVFVQRNRVQNGYSNRMEVMHGADLMDCPSSGWSGWLLPLQSTQRANSRNQLWGTDGTLIFGGTRWPPGGRWIFYIRPLEEEATICLSSNIGRGGPSLPAAPTPVNLQNVESISMHIISSLAREHISVRKCDDGLTPVEFTGLIMGLVLNYVIVLNVHTCSPFLHGRNTLPCFINVVFGYVGFLWQ